MCFFGILLLYTITISYLTRQQTVRAQDLSAGQMLTPLYTRIKRPHFIVTHEVYTYTYTYVKMKILFACYKHSATKRGASLWRPLRDRVGLWLGLYLFTSSRGRAVSSPGFVVVKAGELKSHYKKNVMPPTRP